MTDRQQTSRHSKNRGNLHDFFDANVHESIYGKKTRNRPTTAPAEASESKRTALLRGANGRIDIDRNVLVEDCAAEFRDAWFFKGATRAITHRLDTTVLMPFNPRSASELEVPEQTTKPEPAPKEGKVGLLSQINEQIIEDERETKLHNIKYRKNGEVVHPDISEASRPVNDQELSELFHNVTRNSTIDTFVKRKYVSMRTNIDLGMNSPDIILFKECLKMNVLPPGSLELELQRSSELASGAGYDPSASTRQLALMTSTVLGRASLASESLVDGMHQSQVSMLEDGSLEPVGPAELQRRSSAHSIGSIDSTDIIGVENEQIISINLSNRGIGNDRGICLSAALAYCPHLMVIRLANNRLADRSLSMVFKAVFNLSYCEELDVSHNSLGDLSTACLEQYLTESHCALRRLNLGHCAIDDDNCIRLCRSLRGNESLEALDLSGNLSRHDEFTLSHGDTPSGGAAIAELVGVTTTLRELRIAGNNLRKPCLQLLAEKLAVNVSLRLLDLSENSIGDHDGRQIGRALHSHRALTHLDISNNSISSKGAITIAYAAQQPDSALVYVNLNGNTVGKLGGVYMLRAMRAVASYCDPGHHKHARHFTQPALDPTAEATDKPVTADPIRRLLTIDYRVTVLPSRDENIYDVTLPLRHYALNLADPYDYTVARMLVDQADRHPSAYWKSLKYLQPGSHLWEFIHLGRGGLFELPADFGQTAAQVWSEHAAQIAEAVETIQAAKVAELQAHTSGSRDKQGRRKAFHAPSGKDSAGVTASERLGSAIAVTQSPGGPGRSGSVSGGSGLQNKHFRHQTRSARHVLYRIGLKLGFAFEEDILFGIIDKLCSAAPESRAKLPTLLESIYQQVYAALVGKDSGKRTGQDNIDMHLPMALVAEQMPIFGIYKDNELNAAVSAVERVRRLISESDLSEEKTRLSFKWYLQLMLARQLEVLPPTSRTYWAALNTTHPWAVPTAGLLHVELTYPPLPPTVHHVLSNESLLALLDQVTNRRHTQAALDQIEQVLQGRKNELFLTCSQAEVVLKRFAQFKSHSHFSLVESLVYQLVSPMEARRFIVRNLFFNEILTLRKKLNYMFKVLTGAVTGHYVLDLRNDLHRDVAMRLAELNTFHQMQNLKRDINPSQCGTGDCFRNASLNSAYLLLDSAWFTELPEVGRLRFDYVSPLRCPEGMPPSSGPWGCSFEGQGRQTGGTGDDDSLAPSVYGDDGLEEGVYDETAEHLAQFSSLHGKEQFVQELIENLFAKKFEPRSKAQRKQTRSCPKNTLPRDKRGGAKGTGKFYEGIHTLAKAVGAVKDDPPPSAATKPKVGYVDRIKKIGFDASVLAEAAQERDSDDRSSESESSDDEFGLKKGDSSNELAGAADGTDTSAGSSKSPGSPKRDDSFSQWTMRSKMFQKPPPSTSAKGVARQPSLQLSPAAVKAKPKPVNKLKEAYLAEVTEYWRDTADTCWARCRVTHLEVLKRKLDEVVQDELRGTAAEKDINAGIPPSAYQHKEFVALRNTAIFKWVGQYIAKRARRPGTAAAGGLSLHYSLNQATLWGGVSGSKKYPVMVERASTAEAAAAALTTSATSGKFPSITPSSLAAGTSVKARRRSSVGASMKGKTLEAITAVASTAPGSSLATDDAGAAAVLSKLAFERFLLRLEVVTLYNVWLTVDQVYVVLQALLSHSAPVSVVVRALCVLYNCVVDRPRFYFLLQCGSDQLRNELVHRLDILNVWTPQHPAGRFELDLAAQDHRLTFRYMCALVHDTANKPLRHEMSDVLYYKDSLLEPVAALTSGGRVGLSSPTTAGAMLRLGNASPTASHGGTNDSFVAWTPPPLWSQLDPAGPPSHGHIQFTMSTTSPPAYSVM